MSKIILLTSDDKYMSKQLSQPFPNLQNQSTLLILKFPFQFISFRLNSPFSFKCLSHENVRATSNVDDKDFSIIISIYRALMPQTFPNC